MRNIARFLPALPLFLVACGPQVVSPAIDAASDSTPQDSAVVDVSPLPLSDVPLPPTADVPRPPSDVYVPSSDLPSPSLDVPVPPPLDGAVPPPPDVPGPATGCGASQLDLLLVVDNSNSMRDKQAQLMASLPALLNRLTTPPTDSSGRPVRPAITSLHLGVISTDLGTPGSIVPSCANSDLGDDGMINPIRNGQAIRNHQPWTTTPTGVRPAGCGTDPNVYPAFLTYNSGATDPMAFAHDVACNAYLGTGGCGLEQQLESVYRALIVHDPRDRAGNTDPNAGFVRDSARLGILMLTDEEDGSTRDCRYGERGRACTDGIMVFDSTNAGWSSDDLNLRFYNYVPGSAQDPTWPLDRYIDPTNPTRGFLSLKPGHPELVGFAAITGIPLESPRDPSGHVAYAALLGAAPDGSAGFVGMSAEGPVSMRQRNLDPACSTRVVPACRQQGSAYSPTACTSDMQPFAWPARRIAEVARRFDQLNGHAALHSICANDYGAALTTIVDQALAAPIACR